MKLTTNGVQLILEKEDMFDFALFSTIKHRNSTFTKMIGSNNSELDKEFFIEDKNNNQLILHKSQKDSIIEILKRNGNSINEEDISRTIETKPIPLSITPGFDFRDDLQRNYHKYLLTKKSTYLCQLQPGKGKTGSTILSLSKRDKPASRFVLVIQPKLNIIWELAFPKFTNATLEDFAIISGRESLVNIKENTKDKSIVIISASTLREYIKAYYESNIGLPFSPEEILPILETDTIIVDEAHLDFNLTYKAVLSLNPKQTILLTASFQSSEDPAKIKKFKEILIPQDDRMPEEELDKYVTVIFYQFRFKKIDKIRYINRFTKYYSHILLENSILHLSYCKENYFRMLIRIAERYYDGEHRLLYLFARVSMCEEFFEFIKKNKYFSKLKVSKYVSGDDKSALLSNVIISTDKSCGTGVDIENVQCNVNTISSKSEYSGIQFSGRGRKMEGVEQYYVSLWATNISHHSNYKKKNISLFQERAKRIVNTYHDAGEI